jgi:hypothetical protein
MIVIAALSRMVALRLLQLALAKFPALRTQAVQSWWASWAQPLVWSLLVVAVCLVALYLHFFRGFKRRPLSFVWRHRRHWRMGVVSCRVSLDPGPGLKPLSPCTHLFTVQSCGCALDVLQACWRCHRRTKPCRHGLRRWVRAIVVRVVGFVGLLGPRPVGPVVLSAPATPQSPVRQPIRGAAG